MSVNAMSYFPRAAMTAWLREQLNALFPTGLGEAPKKSGWTDDPGARGSVFRPYAVLAPMSVGDSSGPIGDTGADIPVPYSVVFYGPDVTTVERQSDKVRRLSVEMAQTMVVLDQARWKINQVRPTVIGGVVRNDSQPVSPFSQADVLTFHLTKEIA